MAVKTQSSVLYLILAVMPFSAWAEIPRTPEGKPDGTVTNDYSVRDGVIVIPKNAVIPPGTRL